MITADIQATQVARWVTGLGVRDQAHSLTRVSWDSPGKDAIAEQAEVVMIMAGWFQNQKIGISRPLLMMFERLFDPRTPMHIEFISNSFKLVSAKQARLCRAETDEIVKQTIEMYYRITGNEQMQADAWGPRGLTAGSLAGYVKCFSPT